MNGGALPGYQLFQPLTPDEMEALANDIREHGVLVAVVKDETGAILDGHHRAKIADSLGIDYPVDVCAGLTKEQKLERVFALNFARRHLSGHDRAVLVADLRQRGMSLRAIAKVVQTSHETVRKEARKARVNELTPPRAPDQPEPEPTPEPEPQTRRQRALELQATGLNHRGVADRMGIQRSEVSRAIAGRAGWDVLADWPARHRAVEDLDELLGSWPQPREFAAAIPAKHRRRTARRLRALGMVLGSIALELERSIE